MKYSLLHPTVQQYLALGLTAGEFGGATWLFVHEGHFFAFYLAVTYLVRETSGGKHYHDVLARWVARVKAQAAADTAAQNEARAMMLHDCTHNPF